MSMDSLVLYRNFLEDNRTSMEVYSNNLEQALKLVASDALIIKSYRPWIPNWLLKSKLPKGFQIRYARYLLYPLQAKSKQGTINHIVDQSYGHLLRLIDGERVVITVHDLIPILAWKGNIPGLSYPHFPLFYKLIISSLKKANAIIAVSHSTKRDLINYCGLDASKITVVHNGIDDCFQSFTDEKKYKLRGSFGFPDKNTFIILITGNQSYKNHSTSFQVMSKLQRISNKEIQLVWLGADDKTYEKYSIEINLKNKAIKLNNISLKRLVELYNSVDCLLFPSWYEGFGLPPLEAMACGIPVVTSNVASIPEVVSDAAIMLRPDDVDGLAMAIKNFIDNDTLRKKYIIRGFYNVDRFTWTRHATSLLPIYQKIIDGKI